MGAREEKNSEKKRDSRIVQPRDSTVFTQRQKKSLMIHPKLAEAIVEYIPTVQKIQSGPQPRSTEKQTRIEMEEKNESISDQSSEHISQSEQLKFKIFDELTPNWVIGPNEKYLQTIDLQNEMAQIIQQEIGDKILQTQFQKLWKKADKFAHSPSKEKISVEIREPRERMFPNKKAKKTYHQGVTKLFRAVSMILDPAQGSDIEANFMIKINKYGMKVLQHDYFSHFFAEKQPKKVLELLQQEGILFSMTKVVNTSDSGLNTAKNEIDTESQPAGGCYILHGLEVRLIQNIRQKLHFDSNPRVFSKVVDLVQKMLDSLPNLDILDDSASENPYQDAQQLTSYLVQSSYNRQTHHRSRSSLVDDYNPQNALAQKFYRKNNRNFNLSNLQENLKLTNRSLEGCEDLLTVQDTNESSHKKECGIVIIEGQDQIFDVNREMFLRDNINIQKMMEKSRKNLSKKILDPSVIEESEPKARSVVQESFLKNSSFPAGV